MKLRTAAIGTIRIFSHRCKSILSQTALLVACFAFGSQAHAVCYVNGSATGANDGSSWDNAFTNPQFALLKFECSEIWVTQGVYKPTLGTDAAISFVVPSGVKLYGGFVGGETTRDGRLPEIHLTVLSGDIDNNDENAGTDQVDTRSSDIHGANTHHVVYLAGTATTVDSSTVIDGFTITGGNAPESSGFNSVGGGMYCDGRGNGLDPHSGNCSPTLRHLVFSGNKAGSGGGALYNNGTEGGLSSPTLLDITFRGNRAEVAGGTTFNDGKNGTSSPTLNDVFFNANTSVSGGAMYSIGDGTTPDSDAGTSSPILTNVLFAGNAAPLGAAMYNIGSTGGVSAPQLSVVTFNGNNSGMSVSSQGGAMYNTAVGDGSFIAPRLVNVTFNRNISYAGGAYFSTRTGHNVSSAAMTNVTFSENSAAVGGAIYFTGTTGITSLIMTNVILWDDFATGDSSTAEIFYETGNATISTSVVDSGCPVNPYLACSTIYTGDPKLAPLADNGGFTPTMIPGWGSSAIDTGLDSACPATDQRGITRPQGPHCEIGAVEVIPTPPPPPVALPASVTMLRNTTKQITLQGTDINPGGAFSYATSSLPLHGSVALANQIATYVPAHDYTGLDSFTYTVTDTNGQSLPATVSITVIGPPVAQPFDFTIPLNTTKSITLTATDENPNGAFTFATVDLPQHGSVALVGSVATYTPTTDYTGQDSYTYTATDRNGTSEPATVTIHVLPATVPPVALPRAIVVPYNTSGTITFGATDSNAGGPFVYSFAKASMTTHGTLGVIEGNRIVYVPTHNYSGSDSFTYTVTDVNGTSVPATVTITVLPAGGPSPGGTSAVPAVNALGLMLLSGLVGVFGMARRLR